MWIDAHCHLTGDEFDEVGGVAEVVRRANEQGVKYMVCSGFDLASSIKAKELAKMHEGVYFCAGFHPSELAKYKDGDLSEIKKLCQHEKCVAVGEIGLDYHFEDNPPREMQKELFVQQLCLADEVGLPVVLHSRDAAQDTLEILKANKDKLKRSALMHCYSYSAEMAEEFLKLDLYFSFGGPCTFKNAKKVYESVRRIPAHRILTETDCPYLTPTPFRGEFPNQPKNIPFIGKQLATLKETDEKTLQEQVVENAKRFFSKLKIEW